MENEMNYRKILEDIFNGNRSIAVFVVKGKHYYLIEDKFNYQIDIEPLYRKYIDSGYISSDNCNNILYDFRNGFAKLNEDCFFEFCSKNGFSIYTREDMLKLFMFENDLESLRDFYFYVDNYFVLSEQNYSFQKWEDLAMRLPDFYINFSRKIFLYRESDRDYSDYTPEGWRNRQTVSFGLFVPDNEQYWIIDNMNFWKLQL